MNKCIFSGNLSQDVDVRGEEENMVAKTSLALKRLYKGKDGVDVDFIHLTAFKKNAELLAKYFRKGKFIMVETHVQTGSYTNKEGVKIYTTEYIVDSIEFGPKTADDNQPNMSAAPDQNPAPQAAPSPQTEDGFMNMPEGMNDEGLPWN